MAGLREQKKAEKLHMIREAAWSLFAERGYDATTVRDICQRAGIAVGTLFLYVEDKHELLILLFGERVEAAQQAAMAELPKGPFLDQVVHLFGALWDFYAEDPRLSRSVVKNLMFAEGAAAARLRSLEAELFGRIARLASAAQARGELRADVDGAMLAGQLFAVYFMCLLALLNGMADRSGLDALFRGQAALLMRGVAATEVPL